MTPSWAFHFCGYVLVERAGPPRETLLHGLLVVGEGEQLQVVARMIHPNRWDECHIVVLAVGIYAMFPPMFPCRSMPQRDTYIKLVIVLFNVQVWIIRYEIS